MQLETVRAETVDDVALLAAAAREAGRIALGFFRGDELKSWFKEGEHPVSEADLAVDRHLAERLRGERPGYGWLSEETADSDDRLARRRVFVVDPIDGTRAFIAGAKDWTISLAVVEEGRTVSAALYAPATDQLFTAAEGEGAWLNAKPLTLRPAKSRRPLRVVGPRRIARLLSEAEAGANPPAYISSLALRFALVAAGRFDVALASRGAHDWDIAAEHLILEEAGGRATGLDGAPLRYNTSEATQPGLVGAPEPLHGSVIEAIAAIPARSAP